MKDGACPKCTGSEIFEVAECNIADPRYRDSTEPLTLLSAYGDTGESGFMGKKQGRLDVRLAAYVCAKCSYTELYTLDAVLLEKLASQASSGVRRVKR